MGLHCRGSAVVPRICQFELAALVAEAPGARAKCFTAYLWDRMVSCARVIARRTYCCRARPSEKRLKLTEQARVRPELFAEQSTENASHPAYPWIASPLGDAINIRWWAQSVQRALKDGGRALGFVDTSWVSAPAPKEFGDLKTMSECAWNLESCLMDG